MKKPIKPIFETHVSNGKLIFKITEGQFAGVEYSYESVKLNGELDYKVKNKKSTITPENKILFENTIRRILDEKLKALN